MTASTPDLLPPERTGSAAGPELLERRQLFGPTEVDPALSVRVDREEIAGVNSLTISGGEAATVLYLHGGGFRMGSPEAYTAYAARMAAGAGVQLVLPRYRLAPEHPFPAGLRDVAAVYAELSARRSGPVIVAGDSAGAALATAVASISVSRNAPVSGLMLLSPWLDLRSTSEFFTTSTDPLFSLETARSAREDYLQGVEADNPLASPLLADHSGFPPTLIQVGAAESLVGDALAMARSLAESDVSCTLEILAGQGHTWPLVAPESAASAAAVESNVRFLRAVHEGRLSFDT